jgi:hypothetical protein
MPFSLKKTADPRVSHSAIYTIRLVRNDQPLPFSGFTKQLYFLGDRKSAPCLAPTSSASAMKSLSFLFKIPDHEFIA